MALNSRVTPYMTGTTTRVVSASCQLTHSIAPSVATIPTTAPSRRLKPCDRNESTCWMSLMSLLITSPDSTDSKYPMSSLEIAEKTSVRSP